MTRVLARGAAARRLKLPQAHYVDDYPMIVPADIAEGAGRAFERFLAVLGWRYKPPEAFGPAFAPLGIQIDLTFVITARRFPLILEKISFSR